MQLIKENSLWLLLFFLLLSNHDLNDELQLAYKLQNYKPGKNLMVACRIMYIFILFYLEEFGTLKMFFFNVDVLHFLKGSSRNKLNLY